MTQRMILVLAAAGCLLAVSACNDTTTGTDTGADTDTGEDTDTDTDTDTGTNTDIWEESKAG